MSNATTTVYLYIGMDHARRHTKGDWPTGHAGHLELVAWLETMAIQLDALYEAEFAALDLSCIFDYEVTEELGAWLYNNDRATKQEMLDEARRIVAIQHLADEGLE